MLRFKDNMKVCAWIGDLLPIVEKQVLCFPVLVVSFAAITLLCGGHCALWQWWVSIAMVLAIPFIRRKSLSLSLFGCITFCFLIGVLWLLSVISIDSPEVDSLAYQYPATRLLIEGWNPLYCSTPKDIQATFGIDPWHMRCFHVLFMEKAVWFFNAVAFFFHGEPLSLTWPAIYFVGLGVLLFVVRTLYDWPVFARIFLALLFIGERRFIGHEVDAVIGMSGLGLMMCMANSFRTGKFEWLNLFAFSFWMMTAKASGLVSCFVFWVVFSVVMLIRHRNDLKRILLRLMWIGVALCCLFMIVCASPYISSSINYKHPFYPFMTSDTRAYPVGNFMANYNEGNEDAKGMGRIGHFANAYLSPRMVRAFYNWKLGRNDFNPVRGPWKRDALWRNGCRPNCPTNLYDRMVIAFSLLVFIFLPGRKIHALLLFFGLALMPSYACYGNMRYTPWVQYSYLFAMAFTVACILRRLPKIHVFLLSFMLLYVVWQLVLWMWSLTFKIDYKLAWETFVPDKMFCQIHDYNCYEFYENNPCSRSWQIPDDDSLLAINGIKLLKRRMPNLSNAEIVPLLLKDAYDYVKTPYGFYIPLKEPRPELAIQKLTVGLSRWGRYRVYPSYAWRMWTHGMSNILKVH